MVILPLHRLKFTTHNCQAVGQFDSLRPIAQHLAPLALEAALKLKELSYIHAEGFAAGEMKQPIALIEEGLPVICLLDHDDLSQKQCQI